ncbi:MAG: HEAT repeat domain-containing protein [Verrucomicrobiota bacterium]
MKPSLHQTGLTAAAALAASSSSAQDLLSLDEFITQMRAKDDKVRGPAWQNAGPQGAPAIGPLSSVMTDSDFEVARAAKRALWQIVHHAGRPGADKERKAAAHELLKLLKHASSLVRHEALWMLSEIGEKDAVAPIAALLANRESREDARAALERIPGQESIKALESALKSVPEEFKPAVAQSLRAKGVKVSGYPSQKLVPTRPAGSTATTG